MEKYVVSRELAEKLKAAGYPQKGQFYWWKAIDKPEYVLTNQFVYPGEIVAASLSDELLEALPRTIPEDKSLLLAVIKQGSKLYAAGYQKLPSGPNKGVAYADKPANAIAELWLWCKKNGYIE